MPLHDWTRVTPGTYHDFHVAWIIAIRNALNEGLLPDSYYAQAEQRETGFVPDVLTLQEEGGEPFTGSDSGGGTAVLSEVMPKVRQRYLSEEFDYVGRQRQVTIRHSSDDRIVALIELVSSGNKASEREMKRFVDKVETNLSSGVHLLIVDPYPPTPRDPAGIHSRIWKDMTGGDCETIAGKDRTLAAYVSASPLAAFVEPIAVADELIAMPLFLTASRYVDVPLEETYQAAYRGMPRKYKAILEA